MKWWWGCEDTGTLVCYWWKHKRKMEEVAWKRYEMFIKLKVHLFCDLGILLPSMYYRK